MHNISFLNLKSSKNIFIVPHFLSFVTILNLIHIQIKSNLKVNGLHKFFTLVYQHFQCYYTPLEKYNFFNGRWTYDNI